MARRKAEKTPDFDQVLKRFFTLARSDKLKILAGKLGVSQSSVTRQIQRQRIPESWFRKFGILYEVSENYLKRGDMAYEPPDLDSADSPYRAIKFYNARPGLGPGIPPEIELIEDDPVYVHRKILDGLKGPFTACRVEGESMRPVLETGDIVIVAHGEKKIVPGRFYAVRTPDLLTVKRVKKEGGLLILTALSPNHEPVVIDLADHPDPIVGMVVGGWKHFRDVRW